jgi:hypothetical protein
MLIERKKSIVEGAKGAAPNDSILALIDCY